MCGGKGGRKKRRGVNWACASGLKILSALYITNLFTTHSCVVPVWFLCGPCVVHVAPLISPVYSGSQGNCCTISELDLRPYYEVRTPMRELSPLRKTGLCVLPSESRLEGLWRNTSAWQCFLIYNIQEKPLSPTVIYDFCFLIRVLVYQIIMQKYRSK